jgi:exopolysaccharide biosynthesis polyprenyl glycosylphosphotransferase
VSRRASFPPAWLEILLDMISLDTGFLLAYRYRFFLDPIPVPGSEAPSFAAYVAAIPVLDAIWIAGFFLAGVYRPIRGRSYIDKMFAVIGGATLATLLVFAALYLYHGFPYSRLVLLYTLVAAVALIAVVRTVLRQITLTLRRRGRGMRSALVVGTGTGSELLIQRLSMWPNYGLRVVGIADDRLPPGARFANCEVLGTSAQLPQLIRAHAVEEVFVALPDASHDEVLRLIKVCDQEGVDFRLVPDLLEIITTRVMSDVIDGIPLIGLRQNRLAGANLAIKRSFDLLLGSTFLLLGAIPLALIALAIRLDSPGPALYRQERVGLRGRTFAAYKFRSMIPDAERETGPVFTAPQDPRTTWVGRMIRRFSLDELPQLFNVLKGEMSLVGPRPERPFFVSQFEEEVPRYIERRQVRPGLTGWAQVNDLRQNTSIRDRTIYDIYYIENWSIAFDLKILLLTLWRIFRHRHAY